jgi:hypothetical protein
VAGPRITINTAVLTALVGIYRTVVHEAL